MAADVTESGGTSMAANVTESGGTSMACVRSQTRCEQASKVTKGSGGDSNVGKRSDLLLLVKRRDVTKATARGHLRPLRG
jgi:hypothetical protein